MAIGANSNLNARNLLYVADGLDRGGAEQHLVLVLPRLAVRGWQPSIYCLRRAGTRAAEFRANGIRVIEPPVSIKNSLWGRVFFLPLVGLSALKLLWVLLREKPVIAHFFLPTAYLVGMQMALLARTPVTVMSRRSLNRYSKGRPIASWAEKFLHHRVTAILANSKAVLGELIDCEASPKEKVGLIYNGVDLTAFENASAARQENFTEHGSLRLIIVANLVPYKGHADLLNALAGISDQLAKAWELTCVGRDEGCLSALMDQAQLLGLSGSIKFLGEKTDIPKLLAQSDIGVLCSHQEGFSNSLLEGMAAGLPMIVTDVGGNSEAVIHKQTGLVVPAHNPIPLGEAILSLANYPKLRRKMGHAGRRRAMQYFDIETCVSNYARFYDAILRGDSVGKIDGVGFAREKKSAAKHG